MTLDIGSPVVAFSSAGAAAIGFGVEDADDPSISQAYVAHGPSSGSIGRATRVPGAKQVLALAYLGSTLELLTGNSPSGESCCSSLGVNGHTLLDGLAGAAVGRLLALADGRLLAAVATDHGVWVAQSDLGDRFGATVGLAPAGARPGTLAATSLMGGGGAVAWTATAQTPSADPSSAFVATGSASEAPRAPRTAMTIAGGHRIDQLTLAPSPSVPTLAWIESWFDAGGRYQSRVEAADLGSAPRTLSSAGELAAGLSFAANTRGTQVLTWQACTSSGACSARAVIRPTHGRFGAVQRLGSIDPSQLPTASVGANGEALVGWIDGGHVVAADRGASQRLFGPTRTISSTDFASDLTLAFGPARQALAVWIQGTFSPSVVAAVYRSR